MRPEGLEPKPPESISTLACDYPPDFKVPEHFHNADQLIYAVTGVMEVHVGNTSWWIPPNFAVWIPGRTPHRIDMKGPVSMRTLYMRRGRGRPAPDRCEVRGVSPLLRELILESVRVGRLKYSNPRHRALRTLIIDQLGIARELAASVTMPSDVRALAVARMLSDPANRAMPLASLCRHAGASVRTVERLFARETGVSIESWRRQIRLMKAMEGMVSGLPVKQIAYQLGYRQASPFIEMFRRTVGATPRAWMAAHGGRERQNLGYEPLPE